MIQSPRVFEDAHVPRELPHRHAEIQTLSRAWTPALHDQPADDVIIHGPSGVGKTALAKYGLNHLQAEGQTPAVHVRCLGTTTGDILREMLATLGERPAPNAPLDDLQWTLRDVVNEPVIGILDEADGLINSEALQHLAGIEYLSLVVITHDPEHFLAHVPDRARERLEGERTRRIALDRYGTDELTDILDKRASRGLRPDSVRREQLREIVNEVAGVARKGIQSLRAAVELAEERRHAQITTKDLEDCYARAQRRIRELNLASLPLHHQVLYGIVRDAEEIFAGDLHERYDAIASEAYRGTDCTPISKRSRRNKLQKLEEYDLVECVGDTRSRSYRVCDDAVEPALAVVGAIVE